MTHFADNLTRLCGMHALSAAKAAALIGVSAQTMSEWRNGRDPSLTTAMRAATLFELTVERLYNATFLDLLQDELMDPQRWQRIEERICKR